MLFNKLYNTIMERLKILKKEQKSFFNAIKAKSGLSWVKLGKILDLSDRTLRDWARCKYTPSYEACKLLSQKFRVDMPRGFKILGRYWYIKKYAKRGALARQELYGLLGNIETRRKGGLISQQKRRENPEKYRILGCNVKKSIGTLKPSVSLAELAGIILGDGGITSNQVRITLNKISDREYAKFVHKLMRSIFKESPSIGEYHNVLTLTISGVNVIKELERIGLKKGNKIINQVAIPKWILDNKDYAKVCLRGLIDTDGGVYFHHHKIKGIEYINFGFTFTNHSKPLIHGAVKILRDNNFSPSVTKDRRIDIYNIKEIKRYFKIIGSSNLKHINRLNFYLKSHGK